jgi:hypothetical protein
MKELNYEEDVRIDEDSLDVECLDQAALALTYGKNWAELKRDVERAEEKLKIIRSELIREANEDPVECCGKDKPNAADIEAFYRNDPRHKKAKEVLIEANYELSYGEIAKNEICYTRKAMLEALIRLHGQMYFAGPSVPRDLSFEAKNKHQDKKANIGVGKKMQERTRTRTRTPKN